MQEQKNRSNTRMPVNSYLETNRVQEARRDRQTATGLMALLSVLVPPAGLLAVWRSKRITAPVRIALSMVALVSMTFILWVWLRSGQTSTGILPTPIVPRYAGYNAAAAKYYDAINASGGALLPRPSRVFRACPGFSC